MAVPYLSNPPEIIPINVGRQLFVDNFLVEQTNLDRVFHQAEKYAGNPVLEQAAFRQGGAFYDFNNKRFLAMYRKEPNTGSNNSLTFVESQDLINWNEIFTPFAPIASPNGFWLQ